MRQKEGMHRLKWGGGVAETHIAEVADAAAASMGSGLLLLEAGDGRGRMGRLGRERFKLGLVRFRRCGNVKVGS